MLRVMLRSCWPTRCIALVGIVLFGLLAALVIVPPLAHARPLAAFNRGDVFAAIGEGKIKRFTTDGKLLQTLDTGVGSGETAGMAFDKAGNLYATNFSASQVFKFSTEGTLIGAFGSGYSIHPESIVVDSAQKVYVGQADGSQQVRLFDPTGSLLATYDPQTERRGTDWIDLAADQKTLFYTSEGKSVKRYDVSAKKQLADFNTAPLPGSIAYALRILPKNSGVIVADTEVIVRLDANGKQVKTYDASGEDGWFAVNLDPDGKTFWSGNIHTGQVYRFNIETGAQVASWSAGPVTELGGLAVVGEITVSQPLTMPAIPPWIILPLIGVPLLGLGLFLWLRSRPARRGPIGRPASVTRRPGTTLAPPAAPKSSRPAGKDIRPD